MIGENAEHITVIIVAAGTGTRFGSDMPKQFCDLAGKPVLMHTIDRFRSALPYADIKLVISKQMISLWNEMCMDHKFCSPEIVVGGNSRIESVRNALNAVCTDGNRKVLIHDGVRPLVPEELILRVADAIESNVGVAPAIKVTDSLREIGAEGKNRSVNREKFRSVQTPQGFMFDDILNSYLNAPSDATDDLSVLESNGGIIRLIEGSVHNIKITYPEDIKIAALLMQ